MRGLLIEASQLPGSMAGEREVTNRFLIGAGIAIAITSGALAQNAPQQSDPAFDALLASDSQAVQTAPHHSVHKVKVPEILADTAVVSQSPDLISAPVATTPTKQEFLIGGIVAIGAFFFLVVIPFWAIFTKAGWAGGWALLMLVPLVSVLVLWVFAFRRWPIQHRLTDMEKKTDLMDCRYCGEPIRRSARVCRFCDRDLNLRRSRGTSTESAAAL